MALRWLFDEIIQPKVLRRTLYLLKLKLDFKRVEQRMSPLSQ